MKQKGVMSEQIELEQTENGVPWTIHGIFSDYFLRTKLRFASNWPKHEESELAFQKCRDLFERNKSRLERFANEDQARHSLIEPVLKLLGFFIIPESTLPGKKKTTPDYLLFGDEASREAALDVHSTKRYSLSISIAEAKRYGHNLGDVSKEESPGKFPHQQINEYLREAVDPALRKPYFNWAILTNGRDWRLYYRYVNSYSYFNFDLEKAANSREYFKYFWMLFNANAFIKDTNDSCQLDKILDQSVQHSAALEKDLRRRIYNLLEKLANGFYRRPKNNISEDDLPKLYETCLIYMYRLLFVLYSEGRDLLPVSPYRAGANQAYRDEYSLRRLQEKVKKTKAQDAASIRMYNELDDLFTLIDGNEERMNQLLEIPRYNGGLFSPTNAPQLSKWKVDGLALSEVLQGLMFSFLHPKSGETGEVNFDEPIDYSELDVRQLGSIYEGLLEHHLELSGKKLALVNDNEKVNPGEMVAISKRKQSGSFYTPDYIVKYILNQTVRPLLDQIEADPVVRIAAESGIEDNSFAERVLRLKILDPAMGSGHFLVRATEMLAEEIASHPTTKLAIPYAPFNVSHDEAEIAYWRRRVVESCIYGVDLNPLAVELAKLSLWLTCISSKEPLSFIDHHIQCGNALIGAKMRDLDHLKRAGEETASLMKVVGLDEARNKAIDFLRLIREQESKRLEAVIEKKAIWEEEVVKRMAPFYALSDLRTGFDLGFNLENKEYTQHAEELLTHPESLPEKAAELKEKYRFFHWELAFPEVFPPGSDVGGFDAVIGNPPYVRSGSISDMKEFLAGHYVTYEGMADLYTYFIEQGLNLLRPGGHFGFIVSNKWMRAAYGESLRKFVKQFEIEMLADFGELKVFESSSTFPLVIIVHNYPANGNPTRYVALKQLITDPDQLAKTIELSAYPLEAGSLAIGGFSLVRPDAQRILDKMREVGVPLGQYVDNRIHYGIKTGYNQAFIIDKRKRAELIKADPGSAEIIVPFVIGDDVRKYHINYRERYLIFTRQGIEIENYPIVKKYLAKWQEKLQPKESKTVQTGRKPGQYKWYEIQDTIDYYEEFLKPKIVWPVIGKESRFALDTKSLYLNDKCFIVPINDCYLLGVLNSLPVWFYLRALCSVLGDPDAGGRLELRAIYVKQIPIPDAPVTTRQHIGSLVESVIRLNDELESVLTVKQKSDLKRQIEVAEREIDLLVYKLYGLSNEEIALVEGAG